MHCKGPQTRLRAILLPLITLNCLLTACSSLQNTTVIPDFYRYDRDGIIFHTDVAMRSELLNKITRFKKELGQFFEIDSQPVIEVFLFSNRDHLNQYVQESRPHYPSRRAFYVKTNDAHRIYAFVDDKIETDLRHEITHVFVQAYPREIPLWLDEGLAEYFEVVNVANRVNQPHLDYLVQQKSSGKWDINHDALCSNNDPITFSQANYAESWLWVHWMIRQCKDRSTFSDVLKKYSDGLLADLAGLPVEMRLQPHADELENYVSSISN